MLRLARDFCCACGRVARQSGGQLTMKAAVMNHPLWGRRRRTKQLVLACLIVALVAVVLDALGIVNIGEAGTEDPAPRRLLSKPAHLR